MTKLARPRLTKALLRRQYQELREHPMGDFLIEDLAAAREHGTESARVAIASDGSAVIYGRSQATVRKIGKAIQETGKVHLRPIPELTEEQFDLLVAQSTLADEDDE